MATFEVCFTFDGGRARQGEVDLYDISQALVGFQRSLALTTHLILNNKIITQAPSLEGAQIFALPSEEGSWKAWAKIVVVGGMLHQVNAIPKDTPLGHLIFSAYDYVISETLGFHADYDKSIGQLYEEAQKKNKSVQPLLQPRFDSLVEKCEAAVREMHRPISKSGTAKIATVSATIGRQKREIEHELNFETYEYISTTRQSDTHSHLRGRVTSYNMNTFKGRVYVDRERRPIPFELADSARKTRQILAITTSLRANAQQRMKGDGEIEFEAFRITSKSGRLKGYLITAARRVKDE